MSDEIRIFQVDAFTQRAFAGNPAGVVLGADLLDDAQMQQLARELNNGDTVFAPFPQDPGDELHARFFTPRTEAGFVGHATLALHAVLTQLQGPRTRTQKHRNGSVTVSVIAGTGPTQYAIHQAPPLLGGAPEAGVLGEVLAALGLAPARLDPRCPAKFAGANNARLLIGVRDGADIAALRPDLARLARTSTAGGAAGYFVFTRSAHSASDVESRMFCPALGIDEDPVSGNAHGMLAAYLHALGLLPQALLRGAQGHHMGRPGSVEVAIALHGSGIASLEIRGMARVLFEARLRVADLA